MSARRSVAAYSLFLTMAVCLLACGPKPSGGLMGGEDYLPGPDEFVAFDVPPNPISSALTQYPEMAKKAGIEGMVVLHMLIDRKGDVRDVKLIEGLGAGLDESAIESASKGKWAPATNKGNPVAVWVTFPVRFKLRQ